MEENNVFQIVDAACKLPMVKIARQQFLQEQFGSKYPQLVDKIICSSPQNAGVSQDEIEKIAKNCIKFESTKVTLISAVVGIPGGFAMIGTIPADMAQFYGHVFRIMQKLMYLYGWDDIGSMDDGAKNVLIIFLGVMSGVEGATNALKQIAKVAQGKVAKSLAAKALTKGTIYPIVKKIATNLGIKMTKDKFAKGISKAIPVIGAVTSSSLTLAMFIPMSNKLHKALKENQI